MRIMRWMALAAVAVATACSDYSTAAPTQPVATMFTADR